MSDPTPDGRAMLDEVRRALSPTRADRARVWASLEQRLGPATAPPSPPVAPARAAHSSPAGLARLWPAARVVGIALALVALGLRTRAALEPTPARAVAVRDRRADPPARSGPAELEPTRAGLVAPPPAIALPDPSPPALGLPRALSAAQTARRPAPSRAPRGVLGDDFAAEMRLLSDAQAALRDGAPARALAILERHQGRHPHGALAAEREAARVFALCALGRVNDARARAALLLRRAPDSPYAARIHDSCVGASAPAESIP